MHGMSSEYHNDAFIDLRDLMRSVGVSEDTIRRRLRREGIRVYENPADLRRRLVKRAEVRELFRTPKLARTGKEEAA